MTPRNLPTKDDDWIDVADELEALAEQIRTSIDDDQRWDAVQSDLDLTVGRRVAIAAIYAEQRDEDPRCVCGVHRSEHALCGCERFQTPASWQAEHDRLNSYESWRERQ